MDFYENWIRSEIFIEKFIRDVSSQLKYNLTKDTILFNGLLNHLKPAVYRIKNKINLRTKELMKMINLDYATFSERYPLELSGGQQQRVGVARAFALDPGIILMDEPFSAVDPISRKQLQDELIDIQKKLEKTIVFVTHDIQEAIKIADKICLMNNGEIMQYDTPENIIKNPKNDFIREFINI